MIFYFNINVCLFYFLWWIDSCLPCINSSVSSNCVFYDVIKLRRGCQVGVKGRRGRRGIKGVKGEPGAPGLDAPCPMVRNIFKQIFLFFLLTLTQAESETSRPFCHLRAPVKLSLNKQKHNTFLTCWIGSCFCCDT